MDLASEMVSEIESTYGLKSPKVLSVMLRVPRYKFVSKLNRLLAYRDGPVSIGYGQTMSQPYTVAFMTHLLIGKRDTRNEKVLEIGTGSGYQAAVLARLVKEVYTVEIVPQLARKAKKKLKEMGYLNVHVKAGSGEKGWKEKAPFDAIMVTAGLEDKIPKVLMDQLKVGGVLVAPIGVGHDKAMTKFRKLKNGKIKRTNHGIFHFVPFVEE